MGLFDRVKRRLLGETTSGPGDTVDPQALREQLFGAVAAEAGDEQKRKLVALCRKHRYAIARHYESWKTVPEPIRTAPPAIEQYFQALLTVARVFEWQFHDGSLMASLTARGEENDDCLTKWENRLKQGGGRMAEHDYDAAIAILGDTLIETRNLMEFGPLTRRGLTHGTMGTCYFAKGDPRTAKDHLERALLLCQQQKDVSGVAAYLASLYDVHRYLGETGTAAKCADARAEVLEAGVEGHDGPTEAAIWRAKAAMTRNGEPLNRMMLDIDGRLYELDDVPAPLPTETTIRAAFVRNRPNMALCEALTREGGELGSRGAYYEAIDAFNRACAVDPYDPQPAYERGAALMCLDRASEAAEAFALTDAMAPGWFNCRGDKRIAERVAAGELPQAVYMLLRAQDASAESMPHAERLELLDNAVARFPDVSELHLFRGNTLAAQGDPESAAAAYREGLAREASEGNPDVRTRLLFQLHSLVPHDEGTQLLDRAAAMTETGHLMAATMARLALINRRR